MRTLIVLSAVVYFCILLADKAAAQYYDWGQEPFSVKWKRVEADNGPIVFPDYYERHALRLMNYMDSVRGQVAYGFRRGPMRMPLLLHTQNFAPNGLVMLAPSRMEFLLTPPASTFAMPWHKQLAVHEFRHAVQYNNVNRGFVKVLSYILGQQGSLVGVGQLPFWFIEGDAVLTETQFSTFGRGKQPDMTIDYRAIVAEGKRYRPDKFFSGSYKDHIPDHYTLGYHMVSYTWDKYGEIIWDRVAWFNSRNPYMIFPTKRALNKFYGTSGTRLFHETFDRLRDHWAAIPVVWNSAEVIPTRTTSFTTYRTPVPTGDGTIYAIKTDLDRTSRIVKVDMATGEEKKLTNIGEVNTGLVGIGDKLWWTEQRQSTLWEQRVNSQLRWYDTRTGKSGSVRSARRALFPSASREGDAPAYVEYDPSGFYSIVTPGKTYELPDSLSVHGLSYDTMTDNYYFIALSDCGMWIGRLEERSRPGGIEIVKEPGYAALSDLRADDGRLYYTSIATGRDEAHVFGIESGRESRLSRSGYGSFSPAHIPGSGDYVLTTYTPGGYMLALQKGLASPMEEVSQLKVPVNLFNPEQVRWGVMNIDTVHLDSDAKGREVKRYRKGPRQFRFHSWAPFWFDPDELMDDNEFNVYLGVTAFSQNLLNSTFTRVGYKYTDEGSLFNAGLDFRGLPVNFSIDAEYGTMDQWKQLTGSDHPTSYNNYFRITGRASLPLLLSAGHRIKWLTPSVDIQHQNTLYDVPYVEASQVHYRLDTGVQSVRVGVTYSDNARLAHRDFLPRTGYAVRISHTFTPFNSYHGGITSLFGRVYLPGILPHNSLMLRGSVQFRGTSYHNFRQRDLYPRGARYNISPDRYRAFAADYQLPLWYPDGGINSVLYFKRIRANVFFDYARFRHITERTWDVTRRKSITQKTQWDRLHSYGLDLTFDVVPLRLPASTNTSFTISVHKPSDHSKPVFSAGLTLPI